MKKFLLIWGLLAFVFLMSIPTFAHSGNTDSNGGHYNHDNGEYHYHHGYPAHQHTNGECPYTTKKEETEDSKLEETKKYSFFPAIVISAYFGFIGGMLLFAVLYFPIRLICYSFLENHFSKIAWTCFVLVSVVVFIYIYI